MHNIFDSHAHYDSKRFDADREVVLSTLESQGVRGVMTAGADIPSSRRAMAIGESYDYIFFGAGVHPHEAKTASKGYLDEIREMAKHPKMKAVGEIGLDYYYDHSPRDVQQKVFIEQLKLAKELDLPVIIHNRDAHQDTLDILREYKPRGIVHSYSGSVEMLRELVKLDLYFGYTGVVTFKNARVPLETVAATPLDRILVETDCPYLAPVPFRGQRSDSAMIKATASKMAEIKGINTQELLDITFSNACRVFGIDENLL